jgi:hypothetical protein
MAFRAAFALALVLGRAGKYLYFTQHIFAAAAVVVVVVVVVSGSSNQ